MLTYALAITFVLGAALGSAFTIYLSILYFDRLEKADQAKAQKLAEQVESNIASNPILHPSMR